MTLILHRLAIHKGFRPRGVHSLDLEFAAGQHALVIDREEDAEQLCAVLAGERSPRRGSARLDGRCPHDSPSLRARIGTLFPREAGHWLGATFDEHLLAIFDQRQALGSPSKLCASLWPAEFGRRSVAEATDEIRRRVALAVALSIQKPQLLVLYDVLDSLDESEEVAVVTRLREVEAEGAVIVHLCRSRRVAWRYATQVTCLSSSSPHKDTSYLVRVERPRQLASDLAEQSCIFGTRVDPARPRDLLVFGEDARAMADAIASGIVRCQMDVFEISRFEGTGPGRATE